VKIGALVGVVLFFVVAVAQAGADDATTTTTGAATTTTATTTETTTDAAPAYAPAAATQLPSGCASAGAAAIIELGQAPLAVGLAPANLGASSYPAGAPVVSFETAEAAGASCRPGEVSVLSLSLFGGTVTASEVDASNGQGTVSGLQVEGAAVTLGPGDSVPIGDWGLLVAGDQVGKTLTAPLALHLLQPYAQLPAGTVVLVGFGSTPTPAPAAAAPRAQTLPASAATTTTTTGTTEARTPADRASGKRQHGKRHKRRHKKHLPLKVTPPLGLPSYVFPVAAGADYADTYGANRSDIKDGWHHGDDLFAPLGTPVLAVAAGRLSLVGWNSLGGWRVWLKDAAGNRFYYAHLAAYSRWIIHHRNVAAGQVIGFLGRTGDAFTTPPHLHFEIHPRTLSRLGYDGAVDPTSYLRTWHVEQPSAKEIPLPATLRAPKGAPRQEAAVVWRQLLAARHIRAAAPEPIQPPRGLFPRDDGIVALASGPGLEAAQRPGSRGSGDVPMLLVLGGIAGAGTLTLLLLLRRGRRGNAGRGFALEPEPKPVGASPTAPPTDAQHGSGGPPSLLLLGSVAGAGTLGALLLRRLGRRG